ncbi:hypothetical protein [Arthrobacter sp. MYb213]|uniref:hypothetical protein n=1 Tax=Arthrobacter sp. MYb213 TaxID=1848595 RepID=UPI000CFCBBE9|nr:hypothetical protein [Arthrobacter sp. MYb213]PRB66825.1 hypothetical protein CQ011_17410 [Arthrobacter sp. MYb213]
MVSNQLQAIYRQGCIVVVRDSMNKDFPDSKQAATIALQGIEQAINATCWMETMTTTDGTYPPLDN